MELMHITRQLSDHSSAVTLCGIRFTTDHAATNVVKSTGDWVSCPICEAIAVMDDIEQRIRTETPESEPNHRRMKPRRPTGWTQPAMF